MTERTARLRETSLATEPSITPERAALVTQFHRENAGKLSPPLLRARNFYHLCEHKELFIGDEELIVGERGPAPKTVPTYPELTCHSLDDLRILNTREKTHYRVSEECLRIYEEQIIPYWRGRSMRDRLFAVLPDDWKSAYEAGLFTEFMEQRAPGHTVLDDKIYRRGLLDFKRDIAAQRAQLDVARDPQALAKLDQWEAMEVACDAVMRFARRHAELARTRAAETSDPKRKQELEKIAAVCNHVPANAPRDFHEALQAYWFCHLAVITELNGWDAFSPGHLDQHLWPFYQRDVAKGTLTPEDARELLETFFIKFNNHPAPPKVGVTAAESGTYTDFANINLGGLLKDGSDGSNELTHMLLGIIDEMHLLQPSSNLQLSRKTPDTVLKHALKVIRQGYGFPSVFNADAVVQEQLRQGKSLADAREGGCSGCVETGAFGKEAYILTGYLNLPKVLEIALHNGLDPATGRVIGPQTGAAEELDSFEKLFEAFAAQFKHVLEIKLRGNQIVEQLYAREMPAPFLSVITDDCIAKGLDYNAGGARYNNSYIQFVGIGSLTDSLAALKKAVYADQTLSLKELITVLDANFADQEPLRQQLVNQMPKYGNDDDEADEVMSRAFRLLVDHLDGRPNAKGGHYRVEMLPTTCHIYFGSVTGALPDGRLSGKPLSEGISPVQGADRKGPTAVFKSAAKMDHLLTGGTLLNMKFTPTLVKDDGSIDQWAHLVRSYFRMDGHHVQFNIVKADQLRKAQQNPEAYRDLIVRVAGYSDYFCDLSRELQDEIISRTEHEALQ